jgi:hypothetical protein
MKDNLIVLHAILSTKEVVPGTGIWSLGLMRVTAYSGGFLGTVLRAVECDDELNLSSLDVV